MPQELAVAGQLHATVIMYQGHSRAGLCWPLHPACGSGARVPQYSTFGSRDSTQELITWQSFNSYSSFPLDPSHQHCLASWAVCNPCSALRAASNPFQQAAAPPGCFPLLQPWHIPSQTALCLQPPCPHAQRCAHQQQSNRQWSGDGRSF